MGVSTKVYVNFKDFSQASLHIIKDFIDYVRMLGFTNKTTNTPFKVKCIDNDYADLTVGEEYVVIEVVDGFYKVENDWGNTRWYYDGRFEIVETSVTNAKDKQEFSVGDKVVINKISDDYVSSNDENVKVGDVATVTIVGGLGSYDVRLTNPNWERSWWFSKDDVSFVNNSLDYPLLSNQEVIQAVIDGKELEIQYTDGTWDRVSPMKTTLHQLTALNFRLKPSLEEKRKAVIKKLLTTKVAVLCKCWDDDDVGETIVAITRIDDDYTYPYMNNCLAYKNAYVIDDNGNEITNV